MHIHTHTHTYRNAQRIGSSGQRRKIFVMYLCYLTGWLVLFWIRSHTQTPADCGAAGTPCYKPAIVAPQRHCRLLPPLFLHNNVSLFFMWWLLAAVYACTYRVRYVTLLSHSMLILESVRTYITLALSYSENSTGF